VKPAVIYLLKISNYFNGFKNNRKETFYTQLRILSQTVKVKTNNIFLRMCVSITCMCKYIKQQHEGKENITELS
jgi:hypothetical protein